MVDGLEPWIRSNLGNGQEKHTLARDGGRIGSLEGIFQKRHACKQGPGTRRAKLVLQLLMGVGSTGGRDDSREAVDGVCKWDVVNLCLPTTWHVSTPSGSIFQEGDMD